MEIDDLSARRNLRDYRRSSEANLMQDETMMPSPMVPSPPPPSRHHHQSPGLPSSPDEHNYHNQHQQHHNANGNSSSTIKTEGTIGNVSVKTEPISNVSGSRNTTASTVTTEDASTEEGDHSSSHFMQQGNHPSRYSTTSGGGGHISEDELEDVYFSSSQRGDNDHDEEDDDDTTEEVYNDYDYDGPPPHHHHQQQQQDDDTDDSHSYRPGAVGALNRPPEEEIVFEPNSPIRDDDNDNNNLHHRRNSRNMASQFELAPSYHSNGMSQGGRSSSLEDSTTDRDQSFAMDDTSANYSNASIPAIWATGEEEREGEGGPATPGGTNNNNDEDEKHHDDDDEESEEPAGLEYDNVEFEGCMGRLVLTDNDLRFYRLEEIQIELLWSQVVKRQVSPPTYRVPMLRIKSNTNDNYIFRLASQDMANTMREDLKMFQVGDYDNDNHHPAPPAPPRTRDGQVPPYKQREHASFLVGGATREVPMYRDESRKSISSAVDVSITETDRYDDEDDHHQPRSKASPLLATTREGKGSSSFFEDGDDDDSEEDPLRRRGSLAASKQQAMRERDLLLKEQECKERYDKELKSWIFWTCCCASLLFLVIGGVSGYFIGRETTDNNSDSSKAVAADETPAPVVVAPTGPTIPPATLPPTRAPMENSLPGWAVVDSDDDESPQPTKSPEVTEIPTLAPSLASSSSNNNNNETTTYQPTLRGTQSPNSDPSVAVGGGGGGVTEFPTVSEEEETTEVPTIADETETTPQPTAQPSLSGTEQPSVSNTIQPTVGNDSSTPTVGNVVATTEAPSPAPTVGDIVVTTEAPSPKPDTTPPTLAPTTSVPETDPPTVPETDPPTVPETDPPTVVVETAQPTIGDTSLPTTLPPSAGENADALLELIRSASPDGGAALDTDGSPQQRAYNWMNDEDQLTADLTEPKQLQRYSLATFYYSTGAAEIWDSSPQTRQEVTSWLDPSMDDCEWEFIVCNNDDEIEALEIMPPNAPALLGTLPPQIGLLSALRDLVIDTGNADAAAAARKKQQELIEKEQQRRITQEVGTRQDAVNLLTGPMPSEIGKLLSLETLMITNQALSGLLPREAGNMTSIVTFDFTNNQFAGTLPWELGYLPRVQQLRLGYNNFQARIKSRMLEQENGMAQSISGLFLNNNQLRGALPTTLGLLTKLETGLYLESNRFTGTLPTELSQLTDMKVFRVDTTKLTGTIPSEYREWNSIQEFRVQATAISGEMPGDLCRLFLVQETQSYADCALLDCLCCTYCCSGGVCEEA